jgi:hypothetical protein
MMGIDWLHMTELYALIFFSIVLAGANVRRGLTVLDPLSARSAIFG